MCGICGIFNFSGIGESNISEMTAVMSHRGPDCEDIYRDNYIHLGHRRLSIIDLSDSASQPMCNEDGTIWIVFNGEIYNFRELMQELKNKGHRFKSRSDTEVIIHAYEQWNERAWERFNGMFAFGLWDSNNKTLYLVRDRFGEKPLFYYFNGVKLIFASEVKSILKEKTDNRLNLSALSDYLSLNYILTPNSIIADVNKLPAAHYLKCQDGMTSISMYWDLAAIYNNAGHENNHENYADKLANLLDDSVGTRLESDVPLGAFLSGGIDSSSVVYWMKNRIANEIKTFSIGFTNKSYDELDYSRLVSDYCVTKHHYKIIDTVTPEDIEDMVYFNDEPFGDTSYIPMYILSRLARQFVKVVLSGDGADEIFAGYSTYIADIIYGAYRHTPSMIKFVLEKMIDLFPVSKNKVSMDYKLKYFVKGCQFDDLGAHYYWRVIFDESEKKKLLNEDVLRAVDGNTSVDVFRKYYNEIKSTDYIHKMQYVDIKTWMTDDILTKIDRTSMSCSLESRAPYLDHRLVEFSASIPSALNLKFLKGKQLLKRVMTGKIPDKVIRRKKSGFNSPVSIWFDNNLKGYMTDILSSCNIKKIGLFNHRYIDSLLSEHDKNLKDNGMKLFGLLNFILWCQRFNITL